MVVVLVRGLKQRATAQSLDARALSLRARMPPSVRV
jgi:hypothetical protein